MNYKAEDLIAFEDEVVSNFEQGKIRGPVHLSNGNEKPLIEIFKKINIKKDWVFSTWRNHYHALLKGVPRDYLMQQILEGKSIRFSSLKHKFVTSAIVGGILPIAVGTAYSLQKNEHVWCFIGDMTFQTGIFHECKKYVLNHSLPITFVIEDNGLSTNTPTLQVWGYDNFHCEDNCRVGEVVKLDENLLYYKYFRDKYPHVGIGKFIHF